MAALIELKPYQFAEVLDEYVKVLDEFANIMLSELPRTLPPRQVLDHRIDLELDARPSA